MQRKTKSVIACGMAAALLLTTLGMENEVSAKAAPKMQTKVLSLKKGQKKTIQAYMQSYEETTQNSGNCRNGREAVRSIRSSRIRSIRGLPENSKNTKRK